MESMGLRHTQLCTVCEWWSRNLNQGIFFSEKFNYPYMLRDFVANRIWYISYLIIWFFACLFVCLEKFNPCLGILGSKMEPMPGDPCLVIMCQKSKPLGGTAGWHIPVFLWVPLPWHSREKCLKNWLLKKDSFNYEWEWFFYSQRFWYFRTKTFCSN